MQNAPRESGGYDQRVCACVCLDPHSARMVSSDTHSTQPVTEIPFKASDLPHEALGVLRYGKPVQSKNNKIILFLFYSASVSKLDF